MVCKQVIPSGSFSFQGFHLNEHEKYASVYACFPLYESQKSLKTAVGTYPARGYISHIAFSIFIVQDSKANEAVAYF